MFLFLGLCLCLNFDEPKIWVHEPHLTLEVQFNGEVEFLANSVVRLSPFFAEESVLRSSNVIKELELSKEQESKVEEFLRRIDKQRLQFGSEFPNPAHSEYSELAKKSYWSIGHELRSELDSILLPHQVDRASEIMLRIQLKSNGFLRFVDSVKDISAREKSALVEKCHTIRDSVQTEIGVISKRFMDRVVSPLDAEQKEKFEAMHLGEFIASDFLIAEIELGPKKLGNIGTDTLIELCSKSTVLSWVPNECSWVHGKKTISKSAALYSLTHFVLSENSPIEISDIQAQALRDLQSDISGEKARINSMYVQAIEKNLGKTALESARQQRIELDNSIEGRIEKILLAEQVEVLERQLESRESLRRGFLLMLADGFFDEELKVSEKQRTEMWKILNEECGTLKQELIDIEEHYLSQFLSVLDESNEETLSNALGDRPKFLYPSVLLMLNNLEAPKGFE